MEKSCEHKMPFMQRCCEMNIGRVANVLMMVLAFMAAILSAGWASEGPEVTRLGMNLTGPADWSSELPFTDVFRISRAWVSQRDGAGWGEGPELALDEYGWVRQLEPGCSAETVLCCIDGGHYPSGIYTVYYDGNGEMTFSGAAVFREQVQSGVIRINVDASRGAIFLCIRKTDPDDPIRRIRVMMPGCDDEFDTDGRLNFDRLWNPAFLQRWRGITVLRYMDWMQTNGSTVSSWEQRPSLDDATWSGGIPLEVMCDLSNRLKADPWFCIPHRADDGYIRQSAVEAKRLVAPERRIYVEYSNEVWNSQFAQHRYAADQGVALKLAEKAWEAAWRYTGVRSRQIFAIWYEEFGAESPKRLVRVLASQAANPYVSEQILSADDAGRFADSLAIAPYMSHNIPESDATRVAAGGLDGIFEHLTTTGLPEAIDWMKVQKEVADHWNLSLICYEAGQHLVGVTGGENNEELTRLLHAANRDPRMGLAYTEYYRAWQECGGGLLCHFSSTSVWSKWGSWGIAEFMDDTPGSIPKFQATLEWARSLGQSIFL